MTGNPVWAVIAKTQLKPARGRGGRGEERSKGNKETSRNKFKQAFAEKDPTTAVVSSA